MQHNSSLDILLGCMLMQKSQGTRGIQTPKYWKIIQLPLKYSQCSEPFFEFEIIVKYVFELFINAYDAVYEF